jgi:hypothetical protein
MGLVGKRKWRGGFWPKGLLPPPWFATGQRQGRLGRRQPAGLPATSAAGERGRRERATRGSFHLTHLGPRRREERAPRAPADRWWWFLGWRKWWSVGAEQACLVRCGAARGRHRPFIGPEGRFRGKNLPGDLGGDSGEVGRGGRRGQPWCCLDGTRRAGAADCGSSSQRRGVAGGGRDGAVGWMRWLGVVVACQGRLRPAPAGGAGPAGVRHRRPGRPVAGPR